MPLHACRKASSPARAIRIFASASEKASGMPDPECASRSMSSLASCRVEPDPRRGSLLVGLSAQRAVTARAYPPDPGTDGDANSSGFRPMSNPGESNSAP